MPRSTCPRRDALMLQWPAEALATSCCAPWVRRMRAGLMTRLLLQLG